MKYLNKSFSVYFSMREKDYNRIFGKKEKIKKEEKEEEDYPENPDPHYLAEEWQE